MGVLILSGPPGVGKTTVAGAPTQRSERAVHLEADRFFEPNVLTAISAEFAEMDAEGTAAAVAARLEEGDLAL